MSKSVNVSVYENVYYTYVQSVCSFLKSDFYSIDDFISDLNSGLDSEVKANVLNALNQIKSGGINGSISTLHKKLDKISRAMNKFPSYITALYNYKYCDDEDEDKYYEDAVEKLNNINNSL